MTGAVFGKLDRDTCVLRIVNEVSYVMMIK